MAGELLELAERMWNGEAEVTDAEILGASRGMAEVADGVAFISSFANVSALSTDDGLVLVDTGSPLTAASVHSQVRRWSAQRLNTAVYSHGHIDHVFGVPAFEAEADDNGWEPPRVTAHRNLPRRFDRYVMTAGYNEVVNQRQFQVPGLRWPTEYRYPDRTYDSQMDLEVGGLRVELHHARGETDDHTWTWVPSKRILCCGDFFIWASPNAGNPQKVQRYPLEWAAALREMQALRPEALLPGHGFPVMGADRVSQALLDTAELLESVHDQVVTMMNGGARLDEIVHSVEPPAHLLERPYLRPVYDEPEFIVRNTWRLYGGWYDGNPANLKPAPEAELAREVAEMSGGASRLAERASQLADAGNLRLACHLAEMAALAAPDDRGVHQVRASVFAERASSELSTMSRGIYSWAANESSSRAGPSGSRQRA